MLPVIQYFVQVQIIWTRWAPTGLRPCQKVTMHCCHHVLGHCPWHVFTAEIRNNFIWLFLMEA